MLRSRFHATGYLEKQVDHSIFFITSNRNKAFSLFRLTICCDVSKRQITTFLVQLSYTKYKCMRYFRTGKLLMIATKPNSSSVFNCSLNEEILFFTSSLDTKDRQRFKTVSEMLFLSGIDLDDLKAIA